MDSSFNLLSSLTSLIVSIVVLVLVLRRIPFTTHLKRGDTEFKFSTEIPMDSKAEIYYEKDNLDVLDNLITNIDEETNILFSSLIRTLHHSYYNKVSPAILFRIVSDSDSVVYRDITVNAYVVMFYLTDYPDNKIGVSEYWIPLPLQKNYIPRLKGYWLFSHFIDNNLFGHSPFLDDYSYLNIHQIQIKVFVSAFDENGRKVYSNKTFEWSKNDTVEGYFRPRHFNDKRPDTETYNDVVDYSYNVEWPLLSS